MVAQTAITLSDLSNGRFLLSQVRSGPQVVEGLHGVRFSRPPARIAETVDIVRQVFAGGKISYCQGAEVTRAAYEDELTSMEAGCKRELAFSLGGMSRRARTTTTRPTAGKAGPVAAEVRERWQRGDHEGAAALVTDEMVLATTLVGTRRWSGHALRLWRGAGVNTVRLYTAGATLDAKLGTLGRAHRAVSTANLCQMNLRSRVVLELLPAPVIVVGDKHVTHRVAGLSGAALERGAKELSSLFHDRPETASEVASANVVRT